MASSVTLTKKQAEFALAQLRQRAKMLAPIVHEKHTSVTVMATMLDLSTLIKTIEEQT